MRGKHKNQIRERRCKDGSKCQRREKVLWCWLWIWEKGPGARKYRQFLEAGKVKETGFPLELQERI